MNIREQYFDALKNNKYDELSKLLVVNMIQDFSYKSICDLGTYLCDVDDDGLKLQLSGCECNKLGRKLIDYSFYNYPNETNAFALQYACLEKDNDYTGVINMRENLELLDNNILLNNLAVAYFNIELYSEALTVQLRSTELMECSDATDVEKNIIMYNLLLFKLFNDIEIDNLKDNVNGILNFLISDEIYDYPCAIALAIYFDNRRFVNENINTLLKTFIIKDDFIRIIDEYNDYGRKPKLEEIKDYLFPQTFYENGFYLTQDVNV